MATVVTVESGNVVSVGVVTSPTVLAVNVGSGVQGPAGATGATGAQGPAGPTGATGATGPAGANGISITAANIVSGNLVLTFSNSAVLNVGNVVGPTGATGPQGAQGDPGPTGATGPQGDTGATGATGPQGDPGVSITNANVVSGNLIITFSNTSTVDAGNVVGATGATGDTGPAGVSITEANVASGNLIITFSNTATADAGDVAAFASNATNLTTGTLDTARLPATIDVATAVNVGNSTVNTAIDAGNITLSGNLNVYNHINANGNLNLTGNIQFTDGAVIREVSGDLRLRAAPGEVTQLQGIDSSGFVDSAVRAFYNSGGYVTISTNIDASPEHIWTFDPNGDLTVPNYVYFAGNTFIGDEPGAGTPGFRVVSPLGYGVTIETDSDISGNNFIWSFGANGVLIAPGDVNVGNSTSNVVITSGNITLTGNLTGNTNGFTIGYLDVPQNFTNTSFQLALTDRGKHIYSANGTSQTITIANNATVAFPVGSAISIVLNGAGSITVARGSGVTLYLAANSTSADRTIAAYGMATLLKVDTDTWFINGAGVS